MTDVNFSDTEGELLIQQRNDKTHFDYGKEAIKGSMIASVVAALATLNFGYALGFSSPVEDQLVNDGYLSLEEFSWFNALVSIGAIIGSIVGKFFLNRLGRKITILSTTFFFASGWTLIIAANQPAMFLIGRTLSGVGVGMSSLSVSMYISEVSSSKYRGTLSSFTQLSVTIGVFLAYLMGTVLPSWRWSAVIPLLVVAATTLLMIQMPESPRYDLTHNRKHAALSSLKWLRGPNYDAAQEIEDIEENLDSSGDETFQLTDFKKPSLYQPLFIGAMAMVFQQFCGVNAVLGYCASIFSDANVNNASLVSVVVSLIQIVFTLVSCFLVDRSGRRILLMISGFTMFVCMFILGVYYDVTIFNDGKKHVDLFHHRTVPASQISWLAVLCVILFIMAFSIGWGPIPWILMAELFPPLARDTAGAFVNLVNWLCAFLVLKFFPQMQKAFLQQGAFWFFSGFCLLSFLFTLFVIPETKGKTLEEIELYFTGRKSGREEED